MLCTGSGCIAMLCWASFLYADNSVDGNRWQDLHAPAGHHSGWHGYDVLTPAQGLCTFTLSIDCRDTRLAVTESSAGALKAHCKA